MSPTISRLEAVMVALAISLAWVMCAIMGGFTGLCDDPDPAPGRPTSTGTSVPVRLSDGEYECTVAYGTTIVFSGCITTTAVAP